MDLQDDAKRIAQAMLTLCGARATYNSQALLEDARTCGDYTRAQLWVAVLVWIDWFDRPRARVH